MKEIYVEYLNSSTRPSHSVQHLGKIVHAALGGGIVYLRPGGEDEQHEQEKNPKQ